MPHVELKSNLERDIYVSHIHKILQNLFYTGLMKYKGEIFEGTHEPLVSKKLFDKVQKVLAQRGRTQKVQKHRFSFRNLAKCAYCGCAITAEKKTKKSGREYVYYRCTRKKGPCAEKHFLREEQFATQIKTFLQKVSLSSQDTEKVLAALDSEEKQARQNAQAEAQNLKTQIADLDTKLEKLLDAYLADALSTTEYAAKKNTLISQKATLNDKIADIETRGVSWLEPAREYVLSLNQAANLLSQNDFSGMTAFLKNIGSNHVVQNGQFVFDPKIQYRMTAERSEAATSGLRFPIVWTYGESDPDLRHAMAAFYR